MYQGGTKREENLKCFNLTFSENVASAVEEIKESSDVHHRKGKVYKKKEKTRLERQVTTQRFSGLVDNSNSEEIGNLNAYNIGTKFESLHIKITKCVLCDGK